MIIVQEITEWDGSVPNNIYALSNDKLLEYGFIDERTGKHTIYEEPRTFYPKYRKFEIIKKIDSESKGIAVLGSKGQTYYVKKVQEGYSCTCSGFTFYGKCKHVKQVREKEHLQEV